MLVSAPVIDVRRFERRANRRSRERAFLVPRGETVLATAAATAICGGFGAYGDSDDQYKRRPRRGQDPGRPSLNVLGQYIKDLSFENPNAPQSMMQRSSHRDQYPDQRKRQAAANTDFEVELMIEGKAEIEGTLLFNFELIYAGVFRLQNVPQETMHPIVLIECPRLLFPFAREIIAMRCAMADSRR